MARPVNADAEATRQRILDSALTLFAERGQAASSVRNIASAADVSLAMVHHYFGSKDALYAACVERMYSDIECLWSEIEAELTSKSGMDVVMSRVVSRGLRFGWRHQLPMRLLMRTVMQAGGLDAERRERYQVPFLEMASAYLAHRLGGVPAEYRLPLQSLTFMLARYSISGDEELCFLTGCSDADEARRSVEAHLVETTLRLLRIEPGAATLEN